MLSLLLLLLLLRLRLRLRLLLLLLLQLQLQLRINFLLDANFTIPDLLGGVWEVFSLLFAQFSINVPVKFSTEIR